jgi:hypothetical protein
MTTAHLQHIDIAAKHQAMKQIMRQCNAVPHPIQQIQFLYQEGVAKV